MADVFNLRITRNAPHNDPGQPLPTPTLSQQAIHTHRTGIAVSVPSAIQSQVTKVYPASEEDREHHPAYAFLCHFLSYQQKAHLTLE